MQEINQQEFDVIKNKAENLYKSIVEVYCPYFQERISFNAKGLEHLKFKSRNHARPREDQFIRFKILKYASEIIKQTKTVQGIAEQKMFEFNRSNHRNEEILVNVIFYEFIAVLDRVRVRVIVKEVDKGPKYFWSVIPYWKVGDSGKRRLLYGSPEEN